MDASKMTPEEILFHRRHSPGFNPLEGFGIISKQQWDESQARIAELEAELELRTKERDQAIEAGWLTAEKGEIMSHGIDIVKLYKNVCPIGSWGSLSILYAHLAGRGE